MSFKFFVLSTVMGAVALGSRAVATEYLVSSWIGDKVGRYSSTGVHLGDLTGTTLNGPQAITKGADGHIYVADELNNRIARFNGSTYTYMDSFVTPGSGGLNAPCGLTFDTTGNLLVGSFNGDSVLKYNGTTGASMGTLVAPNSGGLNGPDSGTKIGPDGMLYVPSFWNNQVLRYNATSGAFLGAFVTPGSGGLVGPRDLVWKGNHMYVTSESGNKLIRYNSTTGAFVDTFVTAGSGGLSGAVGITFDDNNNLLVTSGNTHSVLRYNGATGAFMGEFIGLSGGLNIPTYIYAMPAAVPEPASMAVFAIGGVCLAWRKRVRSRR